jgi:hypothetical protein
LPLQAVGCQPRDATRTTVTITSSHGEHSRAGQALSRIAGFFVESPKTAEQLTDLQRWYRILSQAMKKYLRGRILAHPDSSHRQMLPVPVAKRPQADARASLNSRI